MTNKLITIALALSAACFGQTALTSTTTTAVMLAGAKKISLTSVTGVVAGSTWLYVLDPGQTKGEPMAVTRSWNGTSLNVDVQRGSVPSTIVPHISGALVIILPSSSAFSLVNPLGSCVAAETKYTPQINRDTGQQSLCSTKTLSWVPGWNTPGAISATADVASVAGATLPSGPLFHVTGTNAITSWTLPIGFNGGAFTAIFDGAATWTAAGNIALASLEAMTAGCAVTFTYERTAAKWYASTLTCAPTP